MRTRQLRIIPLLLLTLCLTPACHSGHHNDHNEKPAVATPIPLPEIGPAEPYGIVKERGIPIVRSDDPDGLKLYVNVLRPDSDERFPTLLEATAYRRELFEQFASKDLISQGYAMVFLDVPGSGSSEGTWEALSAGEAEAIAWVIDHWIPAQPWSNGKVGMPGSSYMGMTGLLAAGQAPEHLRAVLPAAVMADAYRDVFFQGGIFDQLFIYFWGRFTVDMSLRPPTQLLSPRADHRLEDMISGLRALEQHREHEPVVLSWITQSRDGPFFDERSPMHYWDEIARTPVLMAAGWWGIFTRGSLLNYTGLQAEARKIEAAGGRAGPIKMIVGPWYHIGAAFMEGLPMDSLQKRWFDWHLKADEDPSYRSFDILDPSAPVVIYVLGAEQWRREAEWPLSRARYTELSLSGSRQADDRNESINNASLLWPEEVATPAAAPESEAPSETPSIITYDPEQDLSLFTGRYSRSSVRWLAGMGANEWYAEDERENERLLLTFSTGRLDRDVEVTGPSVLRFWARSDFGPPCDDPPDFWYEQGETNRIDADVLKPWAQRPDVHWTVNLNDVYPDGRVRNVTSGWLSAAHRPDPDRPDWSHPEYDPFDYPEDRNPVPPESGAVHEYVLEIWPISNVFRKGHQIRIDIAVADYPHFLPSLVPSVNEILHDDAHPSRLILPIVPAGSTDPDQWIDDPKAFFAGGVETWRGYREE